MSGSQLTMIAAAIGATVALVTAAASYIVNQMQTRKEHKEHRLVLDKLSGLRTTVTTLQAEIDSLKILQKQQNKRKKRRPVQNGSASTLTECDTDDVYSTVDTDIGDDEFYDCSDIDEDTDTGNGVNESQRNLLSTLENVDENNEVEFQRQAIYDKLKNLVEKDPNQVEVVWRFARACYNYSLDDTDSEKQKQLFDEGMEACENVLDNCHTNLYKWYAILIGSRSKFLPIKDRIADGYRYREYIEKALQIEQRDSTLHHLLGRFKYEVSELSWFDRKMASAIFGVPPSATYDDAVKHFEDAEKLSTKPDLENKLFLGKCYIALSRYRNACEYLREVSEHSVSSEKEREIQVEAESLLRKYSSYHT